MAALLAFILVCVGMATADVAHLTRNYLPPSRLVASNVEITGSRTASFTAGGGYSDRLVQAAPATTYVAPATTVNTFSERLVQAAPAATYAAPAVFSERLVQAAPARSYIAPASASFTSTNSISDFSAPARLTAPATQTFVAPVARTFTTSQRLVAAQAPASLPTYNKQTSARLTAPSREYLSPEVETLEPLVQQSYTAPAVTYNAPAAAAFTSGIDTQYSADGGYVY